MIMRAKHMLEDMIDYRKGKLIVHKLYSCVIRNTGVYEYPDDWAQETIPVGKVVRLNSFSYDTVGVTTSQSDSPTIRFPLEQFLICFEEADVLEDGSVVSPTTTDFSKAKPRPPLIFDDMKKNPPLIFDDSKVKIEQVNHPEHYNKGIEAIDYIDSWGMNFNSGNVIKYVTRAPFKGDYIQDLEKALWYLQRELERVKNA